MSNLQASPDDAKCLGEKPDGSRKCGYRESCGRYMRPVGHYQVYSEFYKFEDDDCYYFEPIERG